MTWSYQRAFLRAHPAPPWTCYFCAGMIDRRGNDKDGLSIHHVDHDHSNGSLENLASAHKRCHNSYHSAGRAQTESTRAKRSASLLGRVFSDESRAKMSASHLRKKTHRT